MMKFFRKKRRSKVGGVGGEGYTVNYNKTKRG